MAMGVISQEEFNKELAKLNGTNIGSDEKVVGKVVDIARGRSIGAKEIPEELRKVIATEAITNGNTQNISEAFGISKSSVDAYKNGATSCATYNSPDHDLANHNNQVKENIASSARSKLMIALGEITSDKVAGAKIKDIASIAKDLSGVVKNMEPAASINVNNNQVIVYRPKLQDEDQYDVITVNE